MNIGRFRYAKPGAGTPGFARLLWWAVASFRYRIGTAGAIAVPLLLSLAAFGTGYGVALLWGGQL